MENRSGLLVDACLTQADGHAERVAALHMIEPYADRPRPITLGGDKGFDSADFVNELRSMNVTPHVAQNTRNRRSAIDGRTTRHRGYAASQRIRKRIEEAFGWIKTVAGQEKTRFRGIDRVGWAFTFAAAAYNLVRLAQAHGGGDGMTAIGNHPLIGRWRVSKADPSDRNCRDFELNRQRPLDDGPSHRIRLPSRRRGRSQAATPAFFNNLLEGRHISWSWPLDCRFITLDARIG